MMEIQNIHPFDLNETEMKQIQEKLCQKIEMKPLTHPIQYVAGVDVAYTHTQSCAVIVVMDYQRREIIETVWHEEKVPYRYVPGLLAFRELPSFLKSWSKLTATPELVFFDGNGILHPKRVGIATHASFFIQKPTIGVAKNPFIGEYLEPSSNKGGYTYIYDNGEIIGASLRTQTNIKPVYISIGNWITLQEAIQHTMHFVSSNSRVPEITRQADLLTKQWKRSQCPKKRETPLS